MNELQTFSNALIGNIRVTMINGEPFFVGKDVADILGYKNTNDAISKRVDSEDKTDGVAICDPMGREQYPVLINESGLYSLIISSKKPEAKRFKRWITSEVIPSIRKHGAYLTPETFTKALRDPEYITRLLTEMVATQKKNQELETVVAAKTQQIAELQPKATYYDEILACADAINISVIAKDYGWSAVSMNKYLHEKGIQYKQGTGSGGKAIWLLYQQHANKAYTSTKTEKYTGKDGEEHTSIRTLWTQKGRLFIYELLKNDGILPIIEKEVSA